MVTVYDFTLGELNEEAKSGLSYPALHDNLQYSKEILMGDSIKAMYEDHDDYTDLCEKYGQKSIAGPHGDYYTHERWIEEYFVKKTTQASWEEYKAQKQIEANNRRIDTRLEEIDRLRAENQKLSK